MGLIISGGRLITSEYSYVEKTLIIEGNKIKSIEAGPVSPTTNDVVIHIPGHWISPGLIDIHVHGAVGFDTMDATHEAIHEMARFFVKSGVTSYLPTTVSASREAIWAAIDNIANCPQPKDGSHHLGIHIEGPYLNPKHCGAQSDYSLRNPDASEYKGWLESGIVKLVSIAPERQGAVKLIQQGVAQGIEFSIAHSGATYEEVIEAADCGVRQATHIFNGMQGLHHREPGTVGAILTDDRIYAQVIVDGIHVHPAVINLVVRAKGVERIILITDAIRALGLQDGEYLLGNEKIIVKNGISRTLAGGLAGSSISLDTAIRNMVSYCCLPFPQVLAMATSMPAKAMGWYGQKGVLLPGADADIAVFDESLNVVMTIVSGCVVYQR